MDEDKKLRLTYTLLPVVGALSGFLGYQAAARAEREEIILTKESLDELVSKSNAFVIISLIDINKDGKLDLIFNSTSQNPWEVDPLVFYNVGETPTAYRFRK